MRYLVMAAAAAIALAGQARAAVYSYSYLAGDLVCPAPGACSHIEAITAPGSNTFSIDSNFYPLALAGSTLNITVLSDYPPAPNLFSIQVTNGAASYSALGSVGIIDAIGLLDARGILGAVLVPPVAYANSATIVFDDDGSIANWFFAVTTGGSADYGSSGPNGMGSESDGIAGYTTGGTWVTTVSTIPLPASGLLLGLGVLLFLGPLRRAIR